MCRSVTCSILRNKEDAEECINDVYIALWNTIPPAPDNLKAYICRIAKNSCRNRLEYNFAQKRDGRADIPLSELGDEIYDDKSEADKDGRELGGIISAFLRQQKPEVRNVFMRRYWLMEPVKDIAARFSFSESKVKSMLFHTRNRLKKYLRKEGIDI